MILQRAWTWRWVGLAATLLAGFVLRDNGLAKPRPPEPVLTVEVYERAQETRKSLGTGFFCAPGKLLTNYHVISDYVGDPAQRRLRVRSDQETFEAKLLSFDVIRDLALLEVQGLVQAPLPLASKPIQKGSKVSSLGNPHNLGMSKVEGIYNGLTGKARLARMLLSAPINPGMSGGPILNSNGEVVGVTVSIVRGANSIAFGIPVSAVKELLKRPQLNNNDPQTLRQVLAEQLRLESRRFVAEMEEALVQAALDEAYTTWGKFRVPRFPSWMDCTADSAQSAAHLSRSQTCHLKVAPYVLPVGDVVDLDLSVGHFSSQEPLGLAIYGRADEEANQWMSSAWPFRNEVGEEVCHSFRLKQAQGVFHVHSCLARIVGLPDLYAAKVHLSSLHLVNEVFQVSLRLKGFTRADVMRLVELLVAQESWQERS